MSMIYLCEEVAADNTCTVGAWVPTPQSEIASLTFEEANQLLAAAITLLAIAYIARRLIKMADES